MRRIAALVLLGLVAGVFAVPAASAAPPVITPGEWFEAEIPFPDVCPDFAMTATVAGKPHSIAFTDASGNVTHMFAGGQLSVTWTRDDTGFSRTFTISGPTFSDSTATAVRGAGRWTTPLEGTGWVLANGNLTLDGYQDGFSLISSYRGHATSICDLMA